MTRAELIKAIIQGATELEDGETGEHKCIEMFCEQLAEEAVKVAFREGALAAGIPLAVVDGKEPISNYRNSDRACEPDISICSSCREHAGFERNDDGECVSECCGAGPINTDPDYDMER